MGTIEQLEDMANKRDEDELNKKVESRVDQVLICMREVDAAQKKIDDEQAENNAYSQFYQPARRLSPEEIRGLVEGAVRRSIWRFQ